MFIVLTDGVSIFDERNIADGELGWFNHIAQQETGGKLYWEECPVHSLTIGQVIVVEAAISAEHDCHNRAILRYLGGHSAVCIHVETCPICHAEDGFVFGEIGRDWDVRNSVVQDAIEHNRPKPGDLIVSEGGNGTTRHDDCYNYAILEYQGEGRAVCIEAQLCALCIDDPYTTVGENWTVTTHTLLPARPDWASRVAWEEGVS